MKAALEKRDAEAARLRQQRDEIDASLKEAKTRLDSRWTHLEKAQELADVRLVQLNASSSEVRRLKARLAASSGDTDLFAFLFDDQNAGKDYVEELRNRLR